MNTEKQLKTPLTYYGGKQTLAPLIVSLFPSHVLYGEPFTGGAAVFFHKPPSKVEVLNDTNGELMNFYRVTRDRFRALQKMIQATLHSRDAFRKAEVIYHNPDLFDEVRRAWAVWVLCTVTFASSMSASYGFDKTQNATSRKVELKRNIFTGDLSKRLERVQIECADALYIIKSRDHEEAFFYCDPPYINSAMGHYKGYTEADYEALLTLLASIKGKFLLSSYPSTILEKFIKKYKWDCYSKELSVSVNKNIPKPKLKTELLVANYPLAKPA